MCSHPKVLKNGQLVPCGKCISCKNKRISEWSTRMYLEAREVGFFNCSFVTLTYNDENLPEDNCLSKRDLQLFLKRLRKFLGHKIRYFAAGEYGSKFGRPHYHIIFFNLSCKEAMYFCDKAWNKGFICVKSVSSHSFRYVAKYCVKEYSKYGVSKDGELIHEFVTMSRCGGIGFCAMNEFSDFNDYCIKIKGRLVHCPKAIKRKLKEKGFTIKRPLKIYCRDFKQFYKDNPLSLLYLLDINPKDIKLNCVEIKSFLDLKKDLLESRQRELNYFKHHTKDFYKFYKDNNLSDCTTFSLFSRFFNFVFF